jgi:hypothetical protein
MAMARLAGRNSLRDIVENISVRAHRLYHLDSAKLTRSNLSRINKPDSCINPTLFSKGTACIQWEQYVTRQLLDLTDSEVQKTA